MALSDGGETLQALVRRNAGLSAAVIRASQRQGIAEIAPGGLHQGAERRTNSNPSSSLVHLIVQHYSASSDARQKDLDRALLLNAAHPHTAVVHLLLESAEAASRARSVLLKSGVPPARVWTESTTDAMGAALPLPRVRIWIIGRRLRFSDAFAHANTHARGAVAVIANADIVFDHTLEPGTRSLKAGHACVCSSGERSPALAINRHEGDALVIPSLRPLTSSAYAGTPCCAGSAAYNKHSSA